MKYSDKQVKLFLRYGYLPKLDHSMHMSLREVCEKEKYDDFSQQEAHQVLCSLIDKRWARSAATRLLIPCGGGMDSRVLLGAAREIVEAKKIELVTYGTPAQLDYRLGQKVAEKMGLVHHKINLFEVNWLELINNYKGEGWYIENLLNSFLGFDPEKYFILVGYMGDPSTGSHLMHKDLCEIEAIDMFDKKNVFTKGSKQVSSVNSDAIDEFDFMDRGYLSFYEQLDFTIRQGSYIKNLFPNNDNVYFPFATSEWLRIVLNLKFDMRKNQFWYAQFANSKYSDLFDLGLKATYGVRVTPDSIIVKLFWTYNKILSLLSRKNYGLERLNANYLNFYSELPKSLSQLQDNAFAYALDVHPVLKSYSYRDPLFRSLASSLGVSYVR